GSLDIAKPVGTLAPGHRHHEAARHRPHDYRCAIEPARAPTAMHDDAVEWEEPRPGHQQHQSIEEPTAGARGFSAGSPITNGIRRVHGHGPFRPPAGRAQPSCLRNRQAAMLTKTTVKASRTKR